MATTSEEAIFHVARTIESPDVLKVYLEQVCGNDTALRRRIEALLGSLHQDHGFLRSSGQVDTIDQPITETAGHRIGPYKLREQIGEGGMGVVFVAEQGEPFHRKVAIKLIKPGMDSREVIARFEAERQALALMDHPNVARVFDAGTTESGRPYFVMELVKGIPLTDYCDRQSLSITERLALFIHVCRAIAHAHQKGIIHRDIKPSNVLVAEHDGCPVPKVIDFGVAKALHQRLTERTIYTRHHQLLGTPMYMSPEQTELSGQDPDIRSDIYSLGVVLYEILTGSLPFDKSRFERVSYEEIRHILLEEEPAKPSTRVTACGDAATTVSTARRTTPLKLRHMLRGDLDLIVMKSLDKDRLRRYQTVNELQHDIACYLDHQPIMARAPSVFYRARKYLHRNRRRAQFALATLSLIAACVAVSLILAGVVRARQRAEITASAHKSVRDAQDQIDAGETDLAFESLMAAREILPNDAQVAELLSAITCTWQIHTTPGPDTIELRRLDRPGGRWRILDASMSTFLLPNAVYHFRISKEGFATSEGTQGPGDVSLRIVLESQDALPAGMVRVRGNSASGEGFDFAIDRFEITNQEFHTFVRAGGYQREELWAPDAPFLIDGVADSFNAYVARCTDRSGRPGPATWINGQYPPGAEQMPVSGVSWYEASAFARFAGRRLPTSSEWSRAACPAQFPQLRHLSNLGSKGPIKVSQSDSLNAFGVYDMAGNVREWCLTATRDGRRVVRGGAWDGHDYMHNALEALPPDFRPANTGFRCVLNESDRDVDLNAPIDLNSQPVQLTRAFTEAELASVRRLVSYDRSAPTNARIGSTKQEPRGVHEVVELDAAYGGEKYRLHLFLPATEIAGTQRFQPIVYFPGWGTVGMKGVEESGRWADLAIVSGLVQTGRAVCWPVFKGTLERTDGNRGGLPIHEQLDFFVRQTKDLSRSVDYLATRPDLDMNGLTYVGWSWGGERGPSFLVLEPRFRAAVLMSGGLIPSGDPTLDGRRYAPLVSVPVLLIAGKFDPIFESRVIPLLSALGSQDKHLRPFESGHTMDIEEAISVIDVWLLERFEKGQRSPASTGGRVAWLQALASGYMGEERFELAEGSLREAIALLSPDSASHPHDVALLEFSLALCLERQDRGTDAITLLMRVANNQRSLLGEHHPDYRRTLSALTAIHLDMAWKLSARSNFTRDAREAAKRHAVTAVSLAAPSPRKHWLLAWTHYCCGEIPEAASALDLSFAEDSTWVGQWALLSILKASSGDERSARDWLTAAQQSVANDDARDSGVSDILQQASDRLGTSAAPDSEPESRDVVAAYQRLLTERPSVQPLHVRCAEELLRVGRLSDALKRYEIAVKLDPNDWRSLHAIGAIHFLLGNAEPYEHCCAQALSAIATIGDRELAAVAVLELGSLASEFSDNADRIRNLRRQTAAERTNMRSSIAQLLCVSHPKAADTELVLSLLRDSAEASGTTPAVTAAIGALTYRLGQYEETLAQLSGADSPESWPPKERLGALVYRAMAHQKLGDLFTSRKLLETAGKMLADASENATQTLSPDQLLARRMIQPVFEEASEQIRTSERAGSDSTENHH